MTAATELRAALAKATPGDWIADTHHATESGGRTYGYLRAPKEMVPLAGFVLGVEGMPQDEGRANLALTALAKNLLPTLLDAHDAAQERIAALEAGLKPFAQSTAFMRAGGRERMSVKLPLEVFETAIALLASQPIAEDQP